jgi:hypothetical protein
MASIPCTARCSRHTAMSPWTWGKVAHSACGGQRDSRTTSCRFQRARMTKGADPTGAGDQDAHGGLLGFYQFNADAIRRGDVTQQVPTVALLECHGKLHAFGTQLIVEGTQIAVI